MPAAAISVLCVLSVCVCCVYVSLALIESN